DGMPSILSLIESDASEEVKAAAFGVLPKIARSEDLDKLLDLLVVENNAYAAAVQAAAVVAVKRSDDEKAQTQVVLSRMRAEAKQQQAFFPVLSGIGGEDALQMVAEYTSQNDPVLRGAATSALA